MKLQYLGDSKDSFKWDYHDFLISELGYSSLNIVLMMTLDDGSSHGRSHPSLFPARPEIINFCHDLRQSRSIENIKTLPIKSGASYEVSLHKSGAHINNSNRNKYFSGFNDSKDQLVFVDPDIGFEPEKSCSEKHVRYIDISRIIKQVSNESVVSVFQHFRHISFPVDFSRIRKGIEPVHSTAIYWHSLMFVAVSKSEEALSRVITANEKYARVKPVEVIA